MIFHSNDIKGFIKHLNHVYGVKYPVSLGMHEEETFIEFLSANPHFLYQFGFDQAQIISESLIGAKEISKAFGVDSRHVFTPSIKTRVVLKKEDTNEWVLLDKIIGRESGRTTHGEANSIRLLAMDRNVKEILLDDLLLKIKKYQNTGLILPTENMIFSNLSPFTITAFLNSKGPQAVRALIQKLYLKKVRLSDLTWQELEDIVSEIFSEKGLKVKQTKRTRDGGRDLIVSGEIFPGEETQMAVEITAQKKVGIDKLSTTLQKNRHYPLIMLATSGTFSSGVLKTKNDPEYQFRLHLKDGESINSWIDSYNKS